MLGRQPRGRVLPATPDKPKTKRRKASPGERREQLIRATLRCIARNGIIGTTLADIAREAGLSQGIVNLHFESKANLLGETLRYLSDDYMAWLARSLGRAGEDAADQLRALVEADFAPAQFSRQKIAVWYAFQGEAKYRPTYRKICRERDARVARTMRDIVERIVTDGGYRGIDAGVVVDALSALTEGLWLRYLINPRTWDADRARTAAHSYLHAVFPREFP